MWAQFYAEFRYWVGCDDKSDFVGLAYNLRLRRVSILLSSYSVKHNIWGSQGVVEFSDFRVSKYGSVLDSRLKVRGI